MINRIYLVVFCVALFAGNAVAQQSSPTLAKVIDRGVLKCGVNPGLIGFAKPNSLGEYAGFDIDFCRAVATAIFNDPDAVEYVPVTTVDRFNALLDGQF